VCAASLTRCAPSEPERDGSGYERGQLWDLDLLQQTPNGCFIALHLRGTAAQGCSEPRWCVNEIVERLRIGSKGAIGWCCCARFDLKSSVPDTHGPRSIVELDVHHGRRNGRIGVRPAAQIEQHGRRAEDDRWFWKRDP
jgi:hypothetical protein